MFCLCCSNLFDSLVSTALWFLFPVHFPFNYLALSGEGQWFPWLHEEKMLLFMRRLLVVHKSANRSLLFGRMLSHYNFLVSRYFLAFQAHCWSPPLWWWHLCVVSYSDHGSRFSKETGFFNRFLNQVQMHLNRGNSVQSAMQCCHSIVISWYLFTQNDHWQGVNLLPLGPQ